jgi:hypothetical protein
LKVALSAVLVLCCSAAWGQAAIVGSVEPQPLPAGAVALVTLRCADSALKIVSAKVWVREDPSLETPLTDSGSMGDKAAGDGIWSISVPVGSDTPAMTYHLVFEAELKGPQGTQKATTTIEAVVSAPGSQAAGPVMIAAPKPEEGVTGKVVVKATINTPAAPASVSCRIGSSALTAMARQADGSWEATVDATTVGNGPQALVVCASAPGVSKTRTGKETGPSWADPATRWCADETVIVRNPYVYCWGDLHAHTSYSDGLLTPKDAYQHARDTSKLDFFSVTDHGEITTAEEMADTIAQADAFNKDGEFVALYGVEWTKRTGHICYYMQSDPSLSPSLAGFWRQVSEMRILAHLNHPDMTNFDNLVYDADADQAIFGVETRSEKEEQAFIRLLDNGWHVAPTGCQDKHSATWGEGPHWTVALARAKTRAGILRALGARRVYSTYDRNMRLALTINNRDMGSRISGPAGTFTVTASVDDPDVQDATSLVQVYLDGKVAHEAKPNAATCVVTTTLNPQPGRHYVFVKVTQADGQKAWSAPIWLYVRAAQ